MRWGSTPIFGQLLLKGAALYGPLQRHAASTTPWIPCRQQPREGVVQGSPGLLHRPDPFPQRGNRNVFIDEHLTPPPGLCACRAASASMNDHSCNTQPSPPPLPTQLYSTVAQGGQGKLQQGLTQGPVQGAWRRCPSITVSWMGRRMKWSTHCCAVLVPTCAATCDQSSRRTGGRCPLPPAAAAAPPLSTRTLPSPPRPLRLRCSGLLPPPSGLPRWPLLAHHQSKVTLLEPTAELPGTEAACAQVAVILQCQDNVCEQGAAEQHERREAWTSTIGRP